MDCFNTICRFKTEENKCKGAPVEPEECRLHEPLTAQKDAVADVLCNVGLVDLVVGFNLTALRLHEKNVENPKLGERYSWNLRANILEDIAKAIECSLEKGN